MKDIILVTGSDGLVGSALKELPNTKEDFIFLNRQDGDLRDSETVEKIFKKYQPRRVIHLAASVGGVKSNLLKPADYFFDNIMMNSNVFKSAQRAGTEKILTCMSTCVFPNAAVYPLTEDQLHNGPPHDSNFGYAYAKRMLQIQSRAYKTQYGMNCIIGIPTNVYGPHDNFDLENGHVLPALINRMFQAMRTKSELVVWGSGAPLREFVFSKDIAQLSLWAIQNYNGEKPIIFSSEKETAIHEVVDLVKTIMGFEGKITFDSAQPDGQFRKPSDGSALRTLLPNFQWTDLREGLDLTIDWFKKNHKIARGAKV